MLFEPVNGAHPRVCGENVADATVESLYDGSSPRVRGKPRDIEKAFLTGGLIPACAGKTLNDLEF